MKITDIKTFVVDCFRTNWVFVKVYTDEGITGVGEATLEYKEKKSEELPQIPCGRKISEHQTGYDHLHPQLLLF